jgi:NAD(P)-dependent dehydrogenase (short-subunit alcohol dehydrogenase family)
LEGRAAIVTGAGSGIGRASAARLASDGAAVLVADLNLAGAEAVADQIRRGGNHAVAILCDVADEASVATTVEAALHEFGSVDIVHNNAALTDPGHQSQDLGPVEISLEVWNRAIAVNLTGQLLLCKYAIPHMLSRGSGSIVNMSSTAALRGDVNGVAYAVSKAGVGALTRAVATKYGPRGIRCNAIAPGIVMTEAVAANLSAGIQNEYQSNLLVPQPASPDDLAAVVSFLSGEDARYINGQVIVADGGATAHTPIYAGVRRLIGESKRRRSAPESADTAP